ncbi:sensor histidine kinase [Deinococcus planocerae]|uniref:sensor histidine kinase n=1 Tax=Deinococcus planocerae TaxID=1737569 RepID=UPI000C7F4BC2|nr:ATP-binding protein [Deinococcus planocerae]
MHKPDAEHLPVCEPSSAAPSPLAQAHLGAQGPPPLLGGAPGEWDAQAPLRELQVHQIELELQNEELLRANAELEDTRAKYLDLFEFAPVGYLTLDRQGIVQEANLTACTMLGVQRERFLSRRFPLFVAPEGRSHFNLLLRRVFEAPDKRVGELTLERAGGGALHVQVEAVASQAGGEPAGGHCRMALIDITAQRQAQDAVLALNQTLEERVEERTARLRDLGAEFERFAQAVAQDLLSPLRHITSFAQLLQQETQPTGEAAGRHLGAIRHSAARMSTLIHALIDVSRASNSRLRLTQVDLGRVLGEVRKELRPGLEERPVALTSDPLPTVQSDSTTMQLIFLHLLSNALKATRSAERPQIHVGVQDTPPEYLLSVRDNGLGFNMRYRDKLFEVFKKVHSDRDFPGAGVGLAVVRRLVARVGGRVWADARLGEGATFWVALPKQPPVLD